MSPFLKISWTKYTTRQYSTHVGIVDVVTIPPDLCYQHSEESRGTAAETGRVIQGRFRSHDESVSSHQLLIFGRFPGKSEEVVDLRIFIITIKIKLSAKKDK